ncbi:MAG TPA: MFS transporter [Rhodopila sp.]|uniref:MFS transporter n=1 Tax=Rhodopila sp. TaxID=2480087 RepID=UPI002BDD83E7|nr:MFS transporter [Rhodopila sp.]HVY16145.1 MFS transporter [Rhodopila sp.]
MTEVVAERRVDASTDGVPMPQRLWAILTIALGLTLAVLDGGIANVALPTIAREVNTSPANSIWVVNAYQLAVTISLLPLSSLGEIYGYRRIYQYGFVLFTCASLACAMSSSLATLTAARVLQGFGAAGIMSVNSALIRFIYPRRWIGRGVGLNATVGSIASALGPSVAAAILSVAPWPWLFAVNVPLGVLGAIIALRALPDTPRSGIRFDGASAALQAIAFGTLLFAVSEMGHGDSWRHVSVELVVAAVAGGVLVFRQLSRTAPMLPVDLFRIPLFALSVASSICSFIAQAIGQVSLPFLFQHHFSLDQVMTGLLMTPWPLVVAVIAPFAGRLADRYPAGLLGGCGMTVMGLGLLAMSLLPEHPTTLDIVWRMTVCGLGFGFFNTPNNRAIITSAPPLRTGGASGMQATARLLGQSMGAALVALIFTAFPDNGPVVALSVAAVAAGVAAAVSFSRLAA